MTSVFPSESVVSYLPDPYAESCYVAHCACRGFYDLMIRIVGRNYGAAKSAPGELQKLKTFFYDQSTPIWNYPFRFNLYRMELCFPEFPLDSGQPEVDIQSDNGILQSILIDKLNQVGLKIPLSIRGAELDYYTENQCDLRGRLFRSLPDSEYSRLHTELGMSHQALTHSYVNSTRQGESI